MKTKHRTLFVAFSSQKGGVGKSTFTAIAASILHYRLGYNVAVFDCDFPQYSLIKMRTRDMATVMENDVFKRMAYKQFTTINKKAYPIMKHKLKTCWKLHMTSQGRRQCPLMLSFLTFPER